MLYVNKNNLYPQIEPGLNVVVDESVVSNAQITTINPLVPNAVPTNYKYYLYYDGQSGCTGTFVVAQDTLVNFFVAGGGGGGGVGGTTSDTDARGGPGGGGGGGVIYGSFVASANQLYNVVVGNGGNGGVGIEKSGITGGSSFISANSIQMITAFGGGGGAYANNKALSGGATSISSITCVASDSTSGNPGGGGGSYVFNSGINGITGGSAYPLNNIPVIFNDGLMSGLYFGSGGGGGGGYYDGIMQWSAGDGGNGGLAGSGINGGGGGGGGYYNGITFGNFNISTNGSPGWFGGGGVYGGGTGGNGSIACGGGGGGNSEEYISTSTAGNGGGGIVMLYYPDPISLNVVGNASISGTLSTGEGLVPRYQSGWTLINSSSSQTWTTFNNTGTNATPNLPNLNFNLDYNQLPLCQVLWLNSTQTVPGGEVIEYFPSNQYCVYFSEQNNINTYYVGLSGGIGYSTGSLNIIFY